MNDISDPRVRRTLSMAQSVVVRCMFGQPPTPRELEGVHRRLSDLLILASRSGTGSELSRQESMMDDLVDTKTAAQMIACSTRWLTRPEMRELLGAARVGRGWFFPRQNVIDYANERRCR